MVSYIGWCRRSVLEGQVGRASGGRTASQTGELPAVPGSLCSCCPEVSFPVEAGIASRRQYLVSRLGIWEMLLDPRVLWDSACLWL